MSSAFLAKKELRFKELNDLVTSGRTRRESWRRTQLSRVEEILEDHESEILQALKCDLGKPSNEAIIEIIALKQELKLAKRKLRQWMKSKHVELPLPLQPGIAKLNLEPLGCILIIGPWNYPFSLTIQPLISALAAGNTVVIKPSEHAPNTSKLIADVFSHKFPKDVLQVCEGDGVIASELIEYPFDHIFFTGGSTVGQKVLTAAAKNLTPVTLELGGQSPAIVLEGADLEVTARRLIWGKGLNAGQTCLAPNHVLVEDSIKTKLIEELKKALRDFYGNQPIQSPDLAKIVNKHHFSRLQKLLEDSQKTNQVIAGGDFDKEKLLISPTIIEVANDNDPLLKDELFGPLLPILTFSDFTKVLNQIKKGASPLAIYMFGGSQEKQEKLIAKTRSGGICFNDVIMQAGIPDMPFGGVGLSGMGRYHGFAGFETFSNKRSILKRPFFLDFKLRYPPYKLSTSILKNLLS